MLQAVSSKTSTERGMEYALLDGVEVAKARERRGTMGRSWEGVCTVPEIARAATADGQQLESFWHSTNLSRFRGR